jgi:kynurenine formamidase
MTFQINKIIDISLPLENTKFSMRTPKGFKKDMQFEMEVLKEHDSTEGGEQIVRGVHMRLHAGSHVDAPEHNTKGAAQITDLATQISDLILIFIGCLRGYLFVFLTLPHQAVMQGRYFAFLCLL